MNNTTNDPITVAVNLRESGALEEALESFKFLKEKFENEKKYRDLVTVLGGMRITYQHLANNVPDNDSEHDKKVLDFMLNAESSINKALYYIDMHKDVVPVGDKDIFLVHSASTKLYLTLYLKDEVERKVKLLSAMQDLNDALANFPGTEAHKAWPLSLKAKILMELGELEDAIESVHEAYVLLKKGYDSELKAKDGDRNLAVWETGLKITEARILDKLKRTDEGMTLLKNVLATPDPESAPNSLELRKSEAAKLIEEFANKTNS